MGLLGRWVCKEQRGTDGQDGTIVVANPSGTSGTDLTRLEINGADYNLAGGEENVQANWTETDNIQDSFIQNKPTILTQSQVDARVQAGVEDWAEDGNTSDIPTSKIPNLNANKITSGTLSASRIPNLNANKITSGTLSASRIPSSIARDSELPASNRLVPSGGNNGQVLAKSSNNNYAVEWIDSSGGGVSKETMSFTSQTSVTFTHNLNDNTCLVQVIDNNGDNIIPTRIRRTSANVVTVTFGTSQTGTIIVVGG